DKDGWRTVKRQIIAEGKLRELEDIGAANMADPATLDAFLQWGIQQYPAQQYMAVFWNHGGGPNGGFGFDENFEADYLSLPELQSAVHKATQATGQRFELIGFDACLMASVEVAHMLHPYANYL